MSFDAFAKNCVDTLTAIYGHGGRTEFWHLLVEEKNGDIGVIPLPNLDENIFRALMPIFVRQVLNVGGLDRFAVACEAWALTENQLPGGKKDREREARRASEKGISNHPQRIEVINLNGFFADGSTFLRTWTIAYDDMRRPRLGETMSNFDVKPGDKGTRTESWWLDVFEKREARAAQ